MCSIARKRTEAFLLAETPAFAGVVHYSVTLLCTVFVKEVFLLRRKRMEIFSLGETPAVCSQTSCFRRRLAFVDTPKIYHQTNRQAIKQASKQTDKQATTDKPTKRQAKKQTSKQTNQEKLPDLGCHNADFKQMKKPNKQTIKRRNK